ncbi:hypothetical protein [Sinorhizobium fredii]|uniref:hypothetical protein n=1 Tax=Rhizobium fredii TaxID=380 RepID=UPI0013E89D0B|nr:hypothetical protein [Sinorhizobium fredii]
MTQVTDEGRPANIRAQSEYLNGIDVATGSRIMAAVEEMLELNPALVLLFNIGQQSRRLYDPRLAD